MKHILIVGQRHVGKSTLIQKIIAGRKELLGDFPVVGYCTKKEDDLRTEDKGSPVYLYDLSKPKKQTEENKVGFCKNHRFQVNLEVFNQAADILMREVPENGMILMDEIGFMEAEAKAFCEAVFHCLDGKVPVLAAVKYNDFPFLEQVRNHPNSKCFYINEENRDKLYEEIMGFIETEWR